LQRCRPISKTIALGGLVLELDSLVLGQLHQLLVGMPMVLDHAPPELLDRIAGRSGLGQPSELDLDLSALGGLLDEIAVAPLQLRIGRRALLSGKC